LDIILFIRMFYRSFFIQTVYNYQSLLSIGFCYAISAILNTLSIDKEYKKQFLFRHLGFFNSHPYFASFAIGAIAGIEKTQNLNKSPDPIIIEKFKNALIGPLGAIGDQLFWVTIRPSCIFLAMVGISILSSLHHKYLILLLVLTIYNIPHIYIRFYGIWQGYRLGFNIYKVLNLDRYHLLLNSYLFIGAIALGTFTGYTMSSIANMNVSYLIVFLISIIITYLYRKYKQSFYGIILISLSVSLVLGFILEYL
jgi:mannose/fructose/N-acetylgalactosamine-specific phosphotransferase system component IID